jgi:hypothetical protein
MVLLSCCDHSCATLTFESRIAVDVESLFIVCGCREKSVAGPLFEGGAPNSSMVANQSNINSS